MKNLFIGLVFLHILFAVTLAAPVEMGDRARHRSSARHGRPFLRHGWSHQILAAAAKRLPNFMFTPVDSLEDFLHVEFGTATHLETSNFRFPATLSMLDDQTIDTGRFSDTPQAVIRSHDTDWARHVMILISDSLVWAFEQKGVSQDTIPQYVRQNVHVTDLASGDQYQLVPDQSPVSMDTNVVTITLKSN